MGYVIAVQIYTMYISKWFGAISNIQNLLIKPGLVVMTWNAQMTITIEFNISGTLLKIWKSENCSTYRYARSWKNIKSLQIFFSIIYNFELISYIFQSHIGTEIFDVSVLAIGIEIVRRNA